MTNHVFIATSLDGFIAKKDGSIDWLTGIENPDQSDYGYEDFISKIDAIVMGRKTYDMAKSFVPWPYKKPLYVLSRTQNEGSHENNVHIVHSDPKKLVEQLNEKGMKNLYIDGGKTIQSFLKEGLIDELTITTIPILLGAGIPLFENAEERESQFTHIETVVYKYGLVKSTYRKLAANNSFASLRRE